MYHFYLGLFLPIYYCDFFPKISVFNKTLELCVDISRPSKIKQETGGCLAGLTKFYPPNGPLCLLEVGCGSGANFEHYPTDYLKMSMAKNDHLLYDSFVVASGEDLRAVEDNSIDVVVCTLVLCSARRVLRRDFFFYFFNFLQGGAFFFMEHVVADPSSWRYFFHLIVCCRYYCGDRCELTRTTWQHLEADGFSGLAAFITSRLH
uniref:Thiol methyltransferase 1A, tandem duplicate 3 n=1 Tax=Electrophorus electricus TaxID=8005 RepID=A0AAY5EUP0_ELEEL